MVDMTFFSPGDPHSLVGEWCVASSLVNDAEPPAPNRWALKQAGA
jgi:hypothetical protein